MNMLCGLKRYGVHAMCYLIISIIMVLMCGFDNDTRAGSNDKTLAKLHEHGVDINVSPDINTSYSQLIDAFIVKLSYKKNTMQVRCGANYDLHYYLQYVKRTYGMPEDIDAHTSILSGRDATVYEWSSASGRFSAIYIVDLGEYSPIVRFVSVDYFNVSKKAKDKFESMIKTLRCVQTK